MSDAGAAFRPGGEGAAAPFRPRASYAGFRAFGSGDGAVLVQPEVARKLRSAAEFATQERRITGGLLYGHGWSDEQGGYLIVDGYLEGGPGENPGDQIARDGTDHFILSEGDLRLLREDAGRMYSADREVGWWRTLAGLGEFGPRDFATQARLVGPDGVGLLIYGSGPHWGTAYLGPDGHAPDTAGTLVAVSDVENGTGESLAPEPLPLDTGPSAQGSSATRSPVPGSPLPGPRAAPPWSGGGQRGARQRGAGVGRIAPRHWVRRSRLSDQGPETPADVQFVVGALVVVTIAAAFIIGLLTSSAIVGVVVAVLGCLVVLSTVWMSRR
jgi:hypothetical protein